MISEGRSATNNHSRSDFHEHYRSLHLAWPHQMIVNPPAPLDPGHDCSAFGHGRYNTTHSESSSDTSSLSNTPCLYTNTGTIGKLHGLDHVPIHPNYSDNAWSSSGPGHFDVPNPLQKSRHRDAIASKQLDQLMRINRLRRRLPFDVPSGAIFPIRPIGLGFSRINDRHTSRTLDTTFNPPSYSTYPKQASAPSRSLSLNAPSAFSSSLSNTSSTAPNPYALPTPGNLLNRPTRSNGHSRSNGCERSIEFGFAQTDFGRLDTLDTNTGPHTHSEDRNIAPHDTVGVWCSKSSHDELGNPSDHDKLPALYTHFSNHRTVSLPVGISHTYADISALGKLSSTGVGTRDATIDISPDGPHNHRPFSDHSGPSGSNDVNPTLVDPLPIVDTGDDAMNNFLAKLDFTPDWVGGKAWFENWYLTEGQHILHSDNGDSISDLNIPANRDDTIGVGDHNTDNALDLNSPDDYDTWLTSAILKVIQEDKEADSLGQYDLLDDQAQPNGDHNDANDHNGSPTCQPSASRYVPNLLPGRQSASSTGHQDGQPPSTVASRYDPERPMDLPSNIRGLVTDCSVGPDFSVHSPPLDASETRYGNASARPEPSPVEQIPYHNNSFNLDNVTPYWHRQLHPGTCPTTMPLSTPDLLQLITSRHTALRPMDLLVDLDADCQVNLDGRDNSWPSDQHVSRHPVERQPGSSGSHLAVSDSFASLERAGVPRLFGSVPGGRTGRTNEDDPLLANPPGPGLSETVVRVKRLYLVRSGEGEHIAKDDTSILDPPLSARGTTQCQNLNAQTIDTIQKTAELVLISPLRRALETAVIAFSGLLARLHKSKGTSQALTRARLQDPDHLPSSTLGPWSPRRTRPLFIQTDLRDANDPYAMIDYSIRPRRTTPSYREIGWDLRAVLWRSAEALIVVISHIKCLRAILGEDLDEPTTWDTGTVRVFDMRKGEQARFEFQEVALSTLRPRPMTAATEVPPW